MFRLRAAGPVVCLFGFISLLSSAQQQKTSAPADKTPRLETLVPPETMLITSAPDVAGMVRKYKDTIPGKLVEWIFSDEFRDLMRSFGVEGRDFPDLRGEMEKGIKKETGFTLDEFFDLFSGEIGFALVNLKITPQAQDAPVKPDLVLKVGIKDQARAEKFFKAVTKKARDIKEFEVAGVKAFTIKSNEPVLPYWAFTPSCFILTTQEARLKDVVAAVMTGKGIEKNMTGDETYQTASRTIKKDEADTFIYWNWKRTLPLIQMGLMMMNPNLLEDLGLDNIKTFSYSSNVKNGRFSDIAFLHTGNNKRTGILKILSTPSTETKDGLVLTSSGDISSLMLFGNSNVAIIAAIAIPGLLRSTLASNEKSAMGTMREMVNQMSQWKQGDRDRNGVNDYWVADVSGLYRLEAAGSPGEPLAMITIDVARADGNPFNPAGGVYHPKEGSAPAVNLLPFKDVLGTDKPIPKAGYFYEAIAMDPNGESYIPATDVDGKGMNATNINRFGFVAYPAEYNVTGINTFIVWENGVVFKADLGMSGKPPYKFAHPGVPPPAPWSTID